MGKTFSEIRREICGQASSLDPENLAPITIIFESAPCIIPNTCYETKEKIVSQGQEYNLSHMCPRWQEEGWIPSFLYNRPATASKGRHDRETVIVLLRRIS